MRPARAELPRRTRRLGRVPGAITTCVSGTRPSVWASRARDSPGGCRAITHYLHLPETRDDRTDDRGAIPAVRQASPLAIERRSLAAPPGHGSHRPDHRRRRPPDGVPGADRRDRTRCRHARSRLRCHGRLDRAGQRVAGADGKWRAVGSRLRGPRSRAPRRPHPPRHARHPRPPHCPHPVPRPRLSRC